MTIEIREAGIAQNGIKAIDTNGNDLPIGEWEADLVWQVKSTKVEKWHEALSRESFATFEDFAIYFNDSGYETRQVYIASFAPEQTIDIIDDWANCNGCGKKISLPEVAFTNNEGCDYCADCYEAIQGDPESAAGLIDTEVDNIERLTDTNVGQLVDNIQQMLREALAIQSKRAEDLLIERNEFREELKLLHRQINSIKSTHVPIASVITLIENYKVGIIDGQPQGYTTKEYLDIIVRGIKNLMK